jgi:U32 family peptidase
MSTTPELVLPAGTSEKLQFACAYGADAVYAGMPQFSLRARTNSFTETELDEGIRYAHERGVRVYVTLNIFARNRRIESAIESLRTAVRLGADAVIMSDPGLIMQARQEFPELELHLSTQANTMNWAAVQFWHTQGIKRVILPRELSIAEIKEIHSHVPDMELEVFVHGAMCISYSGRCLLSSYLTHREANLGACTNSCRWQYRMYLEEATRPGEFFPIEEDEQGTYILNSRDLCAIEYLGQLRDAGVTGFKVEGRTKSVYYLAHIGRAYRKALDDLKQGQAFDPAVFADIQSTASRGYIPGFLIDLPNEARQNYEHGSPEYTTAAFGGVVRSYDAEQHLAEIEVKNRFEVGDLVEWVSPHDVVAQRIEQMHDQNMQPMTVAHGGAGNIFVVTNQVIQPFTILRLRRTMYGTQNGQD